MMVKRNMKTNTIYNRLILFGNVLKYIGKLNEKKFQGEINFAGHNFNSGYSKVY